MQQNPLYFKGCFEGVKSSEIYNYLQKEKRDIVTVMNPSTFLLLGVYDKRLKFLSLDSILIQECRYNRLHGISGTCGFWKSQ